MIGIVYLYSLHTFVLPKLKNNFGWLGASRISHWIPNSSNNVSTDSPISIQIVHVANRKQLTIKHFSQGF